MKEIQMKRKQIKDEIKIMFCTSMYPERALHVYAKQSPCPATCKIYKRYRAVPCRVIKRRCEAQSQIQFQSQFRIPNEVQPRPAHNPLALIASLARKASSLEKAPVISIQSFLPPSKLTPHPLQPKLNLLQPLIRRPPLLKAPQQLLHLPP